MDSVNVTDFFSELEILVRTWVDIFWNCGSVYGRDENMCVWQNMP